MRLIALAGLALLAAYATTRPDKMPFEEALGLGAPERQLEVTPAREPSDAREAGPRPKRPQAPTSTGLRSALADFEAQAKALRDQVILPGASMPLSEAHN